MRWWFRSPSARTASSRSRRFTVGERPLRGQEQFPPQLPGIRPRSRRQAQRNQHAGPEVRGCGEVRRTSRRAGAGVLSGRPGRARFHPRPLITKNHSGTGWTPSLPSWNQLSGLAAPLRSLRRPTQGAQFIPKHRGPLKFLGVDGLPERLLHLLLFGNGFQPLDLGD